MASVKAHKRNHYLKLFIFSILILLVGYVVGYKHNLYSQTNLNITPPKPSPFTEWQDYKNSNYELSYPYGYRVNFIGENEISLYDHSGVIIITTIPGNNDQAAPYDVLYKAIQPPSKHPFGKILESEKNFEINGYSSAMIKNRNLSYPEGTALSISTSYIFERPDKKLYVLVSTNQQISSLNKILESFRFTNQE